MPACRYCQVYRLWHVPHLSDGTYLFNILEPSRILLVIYQFSIWLVSVLVYFLLFYEL